MYFHVFVCICIYLYVFVYICMYLYAIVCIYMYLYVFVCMNSIASPADKKIRIFMSGKYKETEMLFNRINQLNWTFSDFDIYIYMFVNTRFEVDRLSQ